MRAQSQDTIIDSGILAVLVRAATIAKIQSEEHSTLLALLDAGKLDVLRERLLALDIYSLPAMADFDQFFPCEERKAS